MNWILLLIVLAVVAWLFLRSRRNRNPLAPSIPFGPGGSAALDYDALERQFPLSATHLQSLDRDNIEQLNQDQLDQVYARIQSGPIPDGPYQGSFFFAEGGNFRSLADVLGGVRGGLMDLKMDAATRIGELLWQGKVFYRDQSELRNIIDREEVVAALFGVSKKDLRIAQVFGKEVALLFPAHLYVGDSQLDPRRSSVIIDYARTAEIEGYVEKIDRFAGRDGLMIRDEIRMIRPGFYLGRAYFGTLFGLNFTLYNEQVAGRA
jgi:hypothetical protein